jgi:hypothetical protein
MVPKNSVNTRNSVRLPELASIRRTAGTIIEQPNSSKKSLMLSPRAGFLPNSDRFINRRRSSVSNTNVFIETKLGLPVNEFALDNKPKVMAR